MDSLATSLSQNLDLVEHKFPKKWKLLWPKSRWKLQIQFKGIEKSTSH